MRDLNRIILHCSATREGKDFSVDTIRGWHVNGRGWSDIGYHWVIRLDGSIEVGRPLEKSGAHTKGHNKDSVGVCYIGGCDADGKPKDTMNPEQEKAWRMIVLSLRTLYGDLTIHGHNEFANKACPSFTVKEKFADMY
jgi:N-acetylmuramoyl-L-alanine amidase|tara:strand:- start:463 stop:876 length:414 start_codon:yes stop_codon:yes gene_type:complete